jgi:hypothetical protein
MPISASGQVIPKRPVAPDFGTLIYFEDFIYNDGLTFPTEISGNVGGIMGGIADDPLHPGVYSFDMTVPAAAFQYLVGGSIAGFSFQHYETLTTEWLWRLNQTPGGTSFRCSMGCAVNNGCVLVANTAAMQFATIGVCAQHPNLNFWLCTRGAGAEVDIDSTIAVAPLIGTWVKSALSWNRSTTTLSLLINGVIVAQSVLGIPVLGALMPFFAFGSNFVGAINAGTIISFDYLSVSGTLAR